jgi:hypothetical protein
MSGFANIVEKAGDFIKGVTKTFGPANATWNQLYESETSEKLWEVNGQDWYKIFAYQFKVVRPGGTPYYYTLPIPPQAYECKPIIPSKVTPTIGGVTEENSAVTFWLINMSGTTGISASRAEGDEKTRKQVAGKFRETISTTGLLSGTFANIDRIINKAVGVLDTAGNIIQAFDDKNPTPGLNTISGATGEVVGAVNNALLPPLPYSASAVNGVTNGFTEAEELQKFFYIYQKLKSENPDDYNLYFINYKTNQQWRVIVKSFSLQKSAQNPMLYRYGISLQGWDVTPSSSDPADRVETNRFGQNGDLKSINTMAFNNKAVTEKLKSITLNKIGKKLSR